MYRFSLSPEVDAFSNSDESTEDLLSIIHKENYLLDPPCSNERKEDKYMNMKIEVHQPRTGFQQKKFFRRIALKQNSSIRCCEYFHGASESSQSSGHRKCLPYERQVKVDIPTSQLDARPLNRKVHTAKKSGNVNNGAATSSCISEELCESVNTSLLLDSDSVRNPVRPGCLSVGDRAGSNGEEELSPWAKWYLQKEIHRRKCVREEQRIRAERDRQRIEKETAARQKRVTAEKKVSDWLEAKRRLSLERHQLDSQARKQRQLVEESQRQANRERSEVKYTEWLRRKAIESKEWVACRERKEHEELGTSRSRKHAAALAFSQWIDTIDKKHKLPQLSFGIADGKLIAYYDRTANPSPTYVNPNEWVGPLEISELKQQQRQEQY